MDLSLEAYGILEEKLESALKIKIESFEVKNASTSRIFNVIYCIVNDELSVEVQIDKTFENKFNPLDLCKEDKISFIVSKFPQEYIYEKRNYKLGKKLNIPENVIKALMHLNQDKFTEIIDLLKEEKDKEIKNSDMNMYEKRNYIKELLGEENFNCCNIDTINKVKEIYEYIS